jgi:hypothetical protein
MDIKFSIGSEKRNAPSTLFPTIFKRHPVRLSGRAKTVILRDFHQALQANAEIIP